MALRLDKVGDGAKGLFGSVGGAMTGTGAGNVGDGSKACLFVRKIEREAAALGDVKDLGGVERQLRQWVHGAQSPLKIGT